MHIIRSFAFRLFAFRLFAFTLASLVLSAQAPTLVPLTDITGDGLAHAIASTGTFRSITIRSLDTNSTATCSAVSVAGCVRIGDASITTSRGLYLKPGESFGMLESAGSSRRRLQDWFYLVQSGDKISIIYEQ